MGKNQYNKNETFTFKKYQNSLKTKVPMTPSELVATPSFDFFAKLEHQRLFPHAASRKIDRFFFLFKCCMRNPLYLSQLGKSLKCAPSCLVAGFLAILFKCCMRIPFSLCLPQLGKSLKCAPSCLVAGFLPFFFSAACAIPSFPSIFPNLVKVGEV